jgi:acetoin utilization protein AcuB
MTTVCEAMTRNPITIDPDAPVGTAVAVMLERDVRHLPVVDDRGRLLGIVTDRDLRSSVIGPVLAEWLDRRHCIALEKRAENLRVRDVMTWGCATTDESASLEQAAARMLEGHFGCLPVVRSGRLVGILTERDVLRVLRERLPAIRGAPDDYLP